MSSAAGYSSLPPYGRVKSINQSHHAVRRPWRELLSHPSSYSVPHGLADFAARFKRNLSHFRVNYAMLLLAVLFLSLLYHPISIMVFLVASVFWFLLYFHRHEPIVVLGRPVDDRYVLLALGIATVASLVLTGVWLNVVVSISVGVAAIVLHASFRITEDLFLDEDEISDGWLQSVVGPRF